MIIIIYLPLTKKLAYSFEQNQLTLVREKYRHIMNILLITYDATDL